MKLVISHYSALRYWRFIGTEVETELLSTIPQYGSDKWPRPSRAKSLADATSSVKIARTFDPESHDFYMSDQYPLDVLVSKRDDRRPATQINPHIWSTRLPYGSLCLVTDNLYVCSPEFVFLQLAPSLDEARRVQLATELCGTYSLIKGERFRQRTMPLTSKTNLENFVARAERAPGVAKARAALRWTQDNSRSPMETIMFLLLCLPTRLGGYGLPLPKLNPKVDVGTRMASFVSDPYYRPDCLWEKKINDSTILVTAEYDSHEYHDKEQDAEHTRIRRNNFKTLGYLVTSINKSQVRKASEFQYPARQIARDLHLRRKEPEISELSRTDDLIKLLFAEEVW